jgi:hypothetical protein
VRGRLALLAALVAALLYAAFAAGAARQPGEAWFEVAVAALALFAVASALLGDEAAQSGLRPEGPASGGHVAASGTLGRAGVPRAAWWGVGLLAGFAAFSGLSILWSVTPDRSWEELNRALAYALVAGLGVLLGASVERAIERLALGWLAVAAVVAVYALVGKVVPGIHDTTAEISRLRAPLEYWNALGLLCALGVPVAVRLATDLGRATWLRLAGLEAVYLFAVVIGLTYSRGAVAVVGVVAVVLTVLGGARLRGLIVLALGAVAAIAPLAYAFAQPALKTNGAPLAAREHYGRNVGGIGVLCALALLGAGLLLARRERTVTWSVPQTRRVFRIAAAAAAVLVVALGIGLARSQRGLGGSVSHAVSSFTSIRQDKEFDPARLISTNSGNRYVWWKEAIGAWSDRPLEGWGAGSFALLHLRYRTDSLPVTQAHSVPLQMLAETGLIGLVLGFGGVLALLAAALSRLRLLAGRERDLAVALVAAAVAWLVHGFYDWDWNIPAVTAPVLAMLGVVAARPVPLVVPAVAAPRSAWRGALTAVATVVAAVAIVSAVLPEVATHKADSAAALAASGKPSDLEHAAAQADLASRLDPLSTEPLFVAAAVAQARGRLLEARDDLLSAADRQPDDPDAWLRLGFLAISLADRQGAVIATQRVAALDPHNPFGAALARRTLPLLAPPASSATATGTPLVGPAPAP